jgi:low affinity Fe/Cu permease
MLIKNIDMKKKITKKRASFFEKFAGKITKATGTPSAFMIAAGIIIVWGITGPLFGYSDTWQLVINTGTTIITFLMVFVIQHSQNKDTMALQVKLNELIAASPTASNRLIDVEDLTEEEIETLKKFYIKLAGLSKKESSLQTTHSIEEAVELHSKKTVVGTGQASKKK